LDWAGGVPDFKSFYQSLAPTNGWTLEQIGPLQGNSYSCDSGVILRNSKEKVKIEWMKDFAHTIIQVYNPPEFY